MPLPELDRVDPVVHGLEEAIGELVALEIGKHDLHRVAFGTVGRQVQETEDYADPEAPAAMPSGAIQNHNGVGRRQSGGRGLLQVSVHLPGVGSLANMAHGCARCGASSGKQIRVAAAMVAHDTRAYILASPDPGQHALLSGPRLVLKPDLHRLSSGHGFGNPRIEVLAEVLLARQIRLRVHQTWRQNRASQPISRGSTSPPTPAS